MEQQAPTIVAEFYEDENATPKAIISAVERLRVGEGIMVEDADVMLTDDGFQIGYKRDVLAEGLGTAADVLRVLDEEEIFYD